MHITTELMEEMVLFLSQSDQEMARTKALFNGLDRQTKIIKAMQFTRSQEKSQGAREQAAYVSPPYREHIEKLQIAENAYLELMERRSTSIVIIDCWRSLNSARAKGVL